MIPPGRKGPKKVALPLMKAKLNPEDEEEEGNSM
jgi:hypothetical protein